MISQRPLQGRTAIVTGSARNIGKAIAKLFAYAGANVVINGHRDREAIDRTVSEIVSEGGKATGIVADVSDPSSVARMVDRTCGIYGTVDIAISNVSMRRKQGFLDISVEDWQSIVNSNLNSAFYLDKCVLPLMRTRGWGRIIHMSGQDGFAVHLPTRAHNIVCKAGVHALTRALALEFGRDGITANTVSPGVIDTERDWSQYAPNFIEDAVKNIPLGRLGTVTDVANACLYLASEAGGYVSGQVLHVNGAEFRF